MRTLNALYNDEAGFVISAELVLVLTIAVLSMVVGLHEVATAVNTELNDISNAFGSISQEFRYCGFKGDDPAGRKDKSFVAGSIFIDTVDDCDKNVSCDIVCAPADVCGE